MTKNRNFINSRCGCVFMGVALINSTGLHTNLNRNMLEDSAECTYSNAKKVSNDEDDD